MLSDAEHRQELFGSLRDEKAKKIIEERPDDFRGAQHWQRYAHDTEKRASVSASLTPDDVREIRRIYAETDISFAELGRRYGVGRWTVEKVVRRKTWKHVD